MKEEVFSSIDFVGQCLVDNERSVALDKAIASIVKPDHSVLDLGTGSGIMSLFAARAGAKKVTAIEIDPYVASVAEKNFKENGYQNISVLVADARKINLKKPVKYDVVIAEMISTGLVDEFQVQAINNLHKYGVIDSSTIFIPFKQTTFVTLLNVNHNCYGFKMPMVKHLWRWHDWSDMYRINMTDKILLHSVEFNKPINEKVDITISLKAIKTGKVNSVYLSAESFLGNDIVLKDTDALNASVIVPIKDRGVIEGEEIKLNIQYVFGGGYRNFSTEII